MFKLLATTGMRRSELVDITWEQLDLFNNTIRIHGKGKKERLLPLHPMIVPLIVNYKNSLPEYLLHPSQPVFINKNGDRLNPRGLHKILKKLWKKLDFHLNGFLYIICVILLHITDSRKCRSTYRSGSAWP
ncbi:tyrosine-type recombinase/integrase [Aeribacillus sp. FSL K6-2848]|uniref:site-specific integrase n=1 Tax=Aeribacillus sp. FSL K6-2848 TaxID=2954612 RepID=UPI0030F9A6FD